MEKKNHDITKLGSLSPEEYQRMEEQEKDREITRSILRLQSKIRNILYLADSRTSAEEADRADSGEENTPEDEPAG